MEVNLFLTLKCGRIVQFKIYCYCYQKIPMDRPRQLQPQKSARVMAALLLLLQVGIMFAYGFGSKIDSTALNNTDNSTQLIFYVGAAILAIVGWGLIIAYTQNSAVTGLSITLMVIGLTVQLQPLLSIFWNYCFIGFGGVFTMSINYLTASMYACTSLLVAFCYLAGRVSIVQTFSLIIVFNFGWALNTNFVTYIYSKKWANQVEINDDNGANYIYVFGCVFAVVVSLLLGCKPGNRPNTTGSRHSAFIGMIGTGFAFAAFPFSGLNFITIAGSFQKPMNIYFALTASVIMTYWSSTAFGGFKTGVRQSLVGILGGGVMISLISSYLNNVGGCIAIGAFAGVVSGLWLRHGFPRMNKNKPIDPLGLTGPILINAFIGAIGIGPILMAVYKNLGIALVELNTSTNPITQRTSTFYLTIFGITVAVGVGMGLIGGLICLITRDPTNDFQFQKLISKDFGLYNEEQQRRAQNNAHVPESLGQLRNQNL